MRNLKLFLLLSLLGWCINASAQSKLDVHLLRTLQTARKEAPLREKGGNEEHCKVLAILANGESLPKEELKELGVTIGTVIGRVATLNVPLAELEAVAALPQIESLSANRTHEVSCYNTRVETGVSILHDTSLAHAEGLPQGYTGKGVIVGMVDTGIEYTHLNVLDPLTGASRLKGAVLYRPEEGEIENIREVYVEPYQLDTLTTDDIFNDHGTQTTGVAAGSYPDLNLQGMAPEADLILCGTSVLQDDRLIDAMVQTFALAEELGQPCVVNLSIGNPLGWKDGKSAFCLACEALTEGGEAAGRAIVISSGNDGDKHFSTHCLLQDTLPRYMLLEPVVKDGETTYYNPNMDVYCSDSLPLNIDYVLYDTLLGEIRDLPFEQHRWDTLEAGHDGRRHIIIDCDTCQMNSLPHCLLTARLQSTDETPREILSYYVNKESVKYAILPKPRNDNGWLWLEGSPDHSINDLCCNNATISVGAYCSSDTLINVFGKELAPWCKRNEICSFSSYGPTWQGTMKPDVVASGTNVVTSLSSFHEARIEYYYTSKRYLSSPMMHVVTPEGSNRSYYWVANAGTSLSSPTVAGIIALWMEACPTLSVKQIREILRDTSRWDKYCEQAPCGIQQAGNGKVDAVAGMRAVLALASLDQPFATPDSAIHSQLSTLSFDLWGRPHAGNSPSINARKVFWR